MDCTGTTQQGPSKEDMKTSNRERYENQMTNQRNSHPQCSQESQVQTPGHRLTNKEAQSALVDMASPDQQFPPNIRLALVGKTGVGKSKAGNIILDKPNYFNYGCEQNSITKICKYGANERFGTKLQVVDTPGVFDTQTSNDETQEQIKRCIGMTAPGPHAILLCVKMGRFDKTDRQTLEHFLQYFGPELLKFVIVLFTHLDQWEEDNEDQGVEQTKEEYMKNLDPELLEFYEKCNNRHVFINSRSKGAEKERQVRAILKKVAEVLFDNQDACYTNETYKRVNDILEQEKIENPQMTEDEIRESESFLSKVIRLLVNLPMTTIQLFYEEKKKEKK